ncbi:helix-turn-helix domain-containing protein [Streptomyces sp. bgisy153]|uniref:helix-turn-helix domain-containing protein n=1 Tax=Streptomyces sp. bgisy153 TaxID=3413793 RepID=UPI003D707115
MEPFERLDEAMNRRRLELRMNWRQVAEAAHISYTALRAIRRGDYRPAELTARALDEALSWAPGTVYAILGGGDPAPGGAQGAEVSPKEPRLPEPSTAPRLTPSEALRRVVRSSARELGVSPEGVAEVMRLVREDLRADGRMDDVAPLTSRTDLSDLVRERRLEVGLSLVDVAARAVDPESGAHVVDADWLDRLERAALDPSEHPEYPQLDALVGVLNLDAALVQEAAGVQFKGVHTVWSEDGRVRAIIPGEMDAEDLAKVHALMHHYRRSPQRGDGG